MMPHDPKKPRKLASPNDFRLIWDAEENKPKEQTMEQQKNMMRMFAASFKNKNKNKKKDVKK
jgi:hypothetical protein